MEFINKAVSYRLERVSQCSKQLTEQIEETEKFLINLKNDLEKSKTEEKELTTFLFKQ